jgi:hypothetical protein
MLKSDIPIRVQKKSEGGGGTAVGSVGNPPRVHEEPRALLSHAVQPGRPVHPPGAGEGAGHPPRRCQHHGSGTGTSSTPSRTEVLVACTSG